MFKFPTVNFVVLVFLFSCYQETLVQTTYSIFHFHDRKGGWYFIVIKEVLLICIVPPIFISTHVAE
jgi:hypothetical protein